MPRPLVSVYLVTAAPAFAGAVAGRLPKLDDEMLRPLEWLGPWRCLDFFAMPAGASTSPATRTTSIAQNATRRCLG